MFKKIIFSLVLLIFLLSFSNVYAHLDGGKDKTIDIYLIDFGFSPESPKATDKVAFALNLINDTTKEVIVPTSVWIRISSSKETVFTGAFHPEAEHVAFTYTFPYADDYEITARFKDNDNILTKADFGIMIEKEKMSKINSYFFLISAFLLIIIAFIIIKNKIKK